MICESRRAVMYPTSARVANFAQDDEPPLLLEVDVFAFAEED